MICNGVPFNISLRLFQHYLIITNNHIQKNYVDVLLNEVTANKKIYVKNQCQSKLI